MNQGGLTVFRENNDQRGNFPLAYISDVVVVPSQSTTEFKLHGSYFTLSTTLEITGGTVVDNIVFVDAHQLIVKVTTPFGIKPQTIIITNEGGVRIFSNFLETYESVWLDLRLGGNSFTHGTADGNDIRYRNGMNLTRDASGMFFTGDNPWNAWVKFESETWLRGSNKTCQWIFNRPTNGMMIGIGSDATNESSGSQYNQAEVQGYFTNGSTFWGLYGNNGQISSAGNQSLTASIAGGSGFIKLKFENDGSTGGRFTLYKLPSADPLDWDDESQIITTFLIGGSLNPNEDNIMPFLIPRNGGTQRFIALKVD